MNSTAKTTALSFLAAAALGAAVFMGCTVTSTPGTFLGDAGDFNESDTGVITTDSGSDSSAEVCQSARTAPTIVNATCTACLDQNCCAQQQALFAIPTNAQNQAGGNDYLTSIDECADAADVDQCYADTDSAAAPGVKNAYDALIACATQHDCNTACQLADTPDGGTDAGN